jgi:transcriptional regulator with XRE-family HTH domain
MNRIQLRRFELGLTMGQVAEGAGLTRQTVAAAERGAEITAPTARALANFYEITVAELLGVEPTDVAA